MYVKFFIQVCAELNGEVSSYKSDLVDLGSQENYICMNGFDTNDLIKMGVDAKAVSSKLAQKGDAWFSLRNASAVTG